MWNVFYLIPIVFFNEKNDHDAKLMMWNNKCNHPEEDVMFK